MHHLGLLLADKVKRHLNSEIFSEWINFSAELDNALKEHFVKSYSFQRHIKTIQNVILQTILLVHLDEIAKEMKETEFLAIVQSN